MGLPPQADGSTNIRRSEAGGSWRKFSNVSGGRTSGSTARRDCFTDASATRRQRSTRADRISAATVASVRLVTIGWMAATPSITASRDARDAREDLVAASVEHGAGVAHAEPQHTAQVFRFVARQRHDLVAGVETRREKSVHRDGIIRLPVTGCRVQGAGWRVQGAEYAVAQHPAPCALHPAPCTLHPKKLYSRPDVLPRTNHREIQDPLDDRQRRLRDRLPR